MATAGYSILAVLEDQPKYTEMCALLERDPHYQIRRMPVDFLKASEELKSHPADVVIFFAEQLSLSARSWIRKTIEKSMTPVLAVTRERIGALELGVAEKMFRSCAARENPALNIVGESNVKVRILAQMPQKAQTRPQEEPAASGHINTHPAGETPQTAPYAEPHKLIAIGASMGGVDAVTRVLKNLPAEMPGIVVTQHMPQGFTEMFAKSISDVCAMRVEQAADNVRVQPGTIYIAKGGTHLMVSALEQGYVLHLRDGERVEGHIPSVDVLFSSVARAAGRHAMGVILTGMGGDGAKGLLKMREAGAYTIGQDAATALVYGMPRVAFELGAVEEQVALELVHKRMIAYAKR